MKRKFQDLTPDDFPGVDPVKFEEWKKARKDADRNLIIFLIFFLLINVIIFIVLKSLWLGGLVLILIIYFINKKFNTLTKELGITGKMIRQALKGGK